MMILKVYAHNDGGGRGPANPRLAPGMNNYGPSRGFGGMSTADVVAAAGGANRQGVGRTARGGIVSTGAIYRANERARARGGNR